MHHRGYSQYRGFAIAGGFTGTRDVHHNTSTITRIPVYTRYNQHKTFTSKYHNKDIQSIEKLQEEKTI